MSANAVIDGAFSDLKLVKTRSVCQLIVEIPIERAEEAIQKFGIPLPGQEIHVAIARIQPTAPEEPAKDTSKSDAARERFRMLGKPEQMVTRCAIACADPQFQKWLGVDDEDAAAARVRDECGIRSRSELAGDPIAQGIWERMVTDFQIWSGRAAEMRS